VRTARPQRGDHRSVGPPDLDWIDRSRFHLEPKRNQLGGVSRIDCFKHESTESIEVTEIRIIPAA